MSSAAFLVLDRVSMTFPENGVRAVDGVSLEIRSGEIHALVGENGAGKSTLMHIVSGALKPDHGRVVRNGVALDGRTKDSVTHGIVMSYQNPRLVEELTVLENLFLGEEPVTGRVLFDRSAAADRVHGIAPDLDPDLLSTRLFRLSTGRRRMVSLVAALLRLPNQSHGVLILDEPTESTTMPETDRIFQMIRHAAGQGHAVILISHRLNEVAGIADRVSVMRAGRLVATLSPPFSVAQLAAAMTAGSAPDKPSATDSSALVTESVIRPGADTPGQPVEFGLESVTVERHGRRLLDRFTARFAPGQITGLVGLRENGIETLEQVLVGAEHPTSGTIHRAGGGVGPARKVARPGYVPSDRMTRGASLAATVTENLIAVERRSLSTYGVLRPDRVRRFAERCISRFDIGADRSWPLSHLSGGNVQKCILARELSAEPDIMIVCEPGWGLDAATHDLMLVELRRLAASGSVVIVLSTDVDEILETCDRIVVVHDGRPVADLPSQHADRSLIARLVAGGAAA